MDKPLDIIIEEGAKKLKEDMILAVNHSGLPLSVSKMVVESTAREIINSINGILLNQEAEYNSKKEVESDGIHE